MDYLNKPINLQNLSLALAKVKSDYDGKINTIEENLGGLRDNFTELATSYYSTYYSLSISGNTITLNRPDGTTSSITLPVYDGGVSS